MSLKTRDNPETGVLAVFYRERWVPFEEYRGEQIDSAYQNSIRFLRERLGEDAAREAMERDVKSERRADDERGREEL